MVHVEIYTIKGRRYIYLVKNFRLNGKVKHKKRYIRPVEPVYRVKGYK